MDINTTVVGTFKNLLFVYGKDIHIFYIKYLELFHTKLVTEFGQIGSDYQVGYFIKSDNIQKALQVISHVRHPEWYNLQIVQKNTEELEKLQYQICPGKYFLQVIQEEFPKISRFDIAKMAMN